jgi:CRISPR/Cas system-associated exonuclease Cas4 (RecB family)
MKPKREHLSASSLRQLMSCALQWKLKRLDGAKPSHRSPALILGSCYHEIVANALIALHQGKAVESDEVAESFESAWTRELENDTPPVRWTSKVTEENQHELGLRLVGAWFDQGLPLFADAEIVAVELPFTVPIINSDGEVTERPLEGFIDAVIRKDGHTIIVDHKTSGQSSAYSDTEIELDLQASAYVYAAKHLGYGDCELQFHVMSKAKKPKLSVITAPRTEDDFDRLHAIARDAERLIDAGIFLPKPPDWMCAGCSYRAACAKAYRKTHIPVHEAPSAA